MEREEIFEKLTEICEDVFDLDGVELNEDTTADDIPTSSASRLNPIRRGSRSECS